MSELKLSDPAGRAIALRLVDALVRGADWELEHAVGQWYEQPNHENLLRISDLISEVRVHGRRLHNQEGRHSHPVY